MYWNIQCTGIYNVPDYTVYWNIQCTGLYSVLEYTMYWIMYNTMYRIIQCTGIYNVLEYTMYWNIQCTVMYNVLEYTMYWNIQCTGIYNAMLFEYTMHCNVLDSTTPEYTAVMSELLGTKTNLSITPTVIGRLAQQGFNFTSKYQLRQLAVILSLSISFCLLEHNPGYYSYSYY